MNPQRREQFLVAVLGTVVLCLVLLAAATTPSHWAQGPRNPVGAPTISREAIEIPTNAGPTPQPETTRPSPTVTETPPPRQELPKAAVSFPWFTVISLVLFAALAWILLVLSSNQRRRKREADFDVMPAQMAMVSGEEEDHLAAARKGTPRNGIVAAWIALEDAIARLGAPPLPHETSTEMTMRIFATWPIDQAPLDGLAGLYREARFSDHEVTEAKRTTAIQYLERFHDKLREAVAEARRRADIEATAEEAAKRLKRAEEGARR